MPHPLKLSAVRISVAALATVASVAAMATATQSPSTATTDDPATPPPAPATCTVLEGTTELPEECNAAGVVITVASVVEGPPVAAEVPPPGHFVLAEAVGEDSGTQLIVSTDLDGAVTAEATAEAVGAAATASEVDDDEPVTGRVVPGPAACTDGAYAPLVFITANGDRSWAKWRSTPRWYYQADQPSDLTYTETRDAIHGGMLKMANAYNNCSRADTNTVPAAVYGGVTSRSMQFTYPSTTSDGCTGAGDGFTIVGWRELRTPKRAAQVCSWGTVSPGAVGTITEIDMAFDPKLSWAPGSGWYTGSDVNCSFVPQHEDWDINLEAVATHEWGHAYGLDHVAEETHGKLTMSPVINGRCQTTESTLGLGDMLGLERLY